MVICCTWFGDRIAVDIHVGAHVGSILLRETLCQVDDLARLPLLEQCWIAGAIHLLHLPAHWRQHQHILTGSWVGSNLHALAHSLHHCLMVAIASMQIDSVALGALTVQVVIYQP